METMNNVFKQCGLPHEQSSTRSSSRVEVASVFGSALTLRAALCSLLGIGLLTSSSMAQDVNVVPQQDSVTIVERGADYRVVQAVSSELDADGVSVTRTNIYTELSTGIHYLKDGQWLETQEQIQVAPDGSAAYAVQGPHQVTFSANINSVPAITLLTADAKNFQSRILGISYYDAASGKSVLIAETKDAIGQVLLPNQVIYPDAITDFRCDV